MISWNNQLFIGPMPGTSDSIPTWKTDLREYRITGIVCLCYPHELEAISPEYVLERRIGNLPPLTDAPFPSDGEPTGRDRRTFWKTAYRTAKALNRGEAVFIHCDTGNERTATFSIATLTCLFADTQKAEEAIAELGIFPQVDLHLGFVRALWGYWQGVRAVVAEDGG